MVWLVNWRSRGYRELEQATAMLLTSEIFQCRMMGIDAIIFLGGRATV